MKVGLQDEKIKQQGELIKLMT